MEKTFANRKTLKFAKVFAHESFPLYGMFTVLLFMEVTVFLAESRALIVPFLELIKVRKANLKRLIALSYKIVQCHILFPFLI